MRRFSQRNALVTLNEINITPLLDLAFVLLIIFVITTPLLEQSIKMNLPTGGAQDSPRTKEDIRTVEVDQLGGYVMKGKKMTLDMVEATLVEAFQKNPKLAVVIRADAKEHFENVLAVVDRCQKRGINQVGFKTKNKS